MELAVLDNRFRRVRAIENWRSLIWTERYFTNGEFELQSNRISEVLELLPLKSRTEPPTVVALRDSTVPMIVETHKIEEDKSGTPIITTSGRSFESVLDRRISVKSHSATTKRAPWEVKAASPSDVVWYVINQIVKLGIASPLDIIPEVTIKDSVTAAWPAGEETYVIEPKELYEWALEVLKIAEHGLRSVLPPSDSSIETIELEIYDGSDRRETVVFDTLQDQFTKTAHLLSVVGHKNAMTTDLVNGTVPANTGTAYSGLARRVGYQDLSSELTLASSDANFQTVGKNRGIVALGELTPIALFSGEVAARQAAKYNQDYFLGDKVTLNGEYGLTQDVRIAEFVRTHDLEGERSYPTFASLVDGTE